MTDQDRPDGDEPGFDDPADAWVRDLLASARVTGPVPDDVAARLESTLASLRAERVGEAADPVPDEPAPVVPLRRRLAPLLAAAAAVVVVAGGAVGVSRLASDHGAQNSAAGSSSAGTAEGGAAVPRTPLDQRSGGVAAATALPRLSRKAFAQDAAAVMRTFSTDLRGASGGGTVGATPGTTPAPTSSTTDSAEQPHAAEKGAAPPVTATPGAAALSAPVAACPGPVSPGAVTVPATLDGTPVALVFRPPTATEQRVEAWSCDGTKLLDSASVRH